MPQPTQSSLVHVLLMWTVVLSIIQGVFIVLFFTSGKPDQNSGVPAPGGTAQPQAGTTHSTPPADDSYHPGEMNVYKFTAVNNNIRWQARFLEGTSVLTQGKDLKIQTNGYYFLSFRLTLFPNCKCNARSKGCMVTLSKEGQRLVEGWINPHTCSTGLLGTVEVLSRGSTLSFTIDMPLGNITQNESLTHLAVVMLRKRPQ